jgi:hypothetical protein
LRRESTGRALRAWAWAALLQLLIATAPSGARAQPTAADAGAPAPGSPSANGSYLTSRLVPPKSEGACPPNIDPMYRADAIVTGTDMRQRPWGFAQTLREVLVKSSGDRGSRMTRAPRRSPSMRIVLSPASTMPT